GLRRLLALQLPRPARTMQRRMDARVLLGLATAPHGSVTAAIDDGLDAVLDALILEAGGVVWDVEGFDRLLAIVRDRWVEDLATVVAAMADSIRRADRLGERLARPAPEEWGPALDDITEQVAGLVYAGMAVTAGADRIAHVPRYLEAV